MDSTVKGIETFGSYQLRIYGLVALPLILSAGFKMDYVFTAGEVKYRCLIPECENPNNATLTGPAWLNTSLSAENCKRYAVREPRISEDCASPEFFDETKIVDCDAWVYDPDEVTIHNEWGIVCDANRWKLTLIGTINNLGQIVGLSIVSHLSDKYGRRTMLSLITCLAGISGLIHSFAVNYWMFIIFEFIDACFASGIYSGSFIYVMEMTGSRKRTLGSAFVSCTYALGNVWLGFSAMWVKKWRTLMRVIYGPGLLVILLLFILPESVRWLLVNGKRDVAEKIYRKMARVNKVTLSEDAFLELKNIHNQRRISDNAEIQSSKDNCRVETLSHIRKSPKILMRLLICTFCWLTDTFVYFGMSLNATELSGNKYLNYVYVTGIEIPCNMLGFFLLNRLGRKPTLSIAFILSGLFCLASQLIPHESTGTWQVMSLVLYSLGKGCISMAFLCTYVYTTELFPTTLRHSLLGICSVTGRIGSTIAPQTPLIAKFTFAELPVILFGSMALAAGLLSLNFPETLGTQLPDTLAEAEQIGCKKIKKTVNSSDNDIDV